MYPSPRAIAFARLYCAVERARRVCMPRACTSSGSRELFACVGAKYEYRGKKQIYVTLCVMWERMRVEMLWRRIGCCMLSEWKAKVW
jgi:hypothetical protein